MTLLVDIGNSAIKWARLDAQGNLGVSWRQLHRGVNDVAAQLIERWRDVEVGTAVIGCSVAGPGVVAAVEQAAQALGLDAPRWLRAQPRFAGAFSLVNGYRDPATLGADRWHCMLGACAVSAPPLVVVNAGTATTVDCVAANDATAGDRLSSGTFVGGFIAPGVRLMLESLARGTAGLPAATGEASAFPDNTDAAIVSGVLDAQAGLVREVWRRFAAKLAAMPRLILTGGHAGALFARLSVPAAAIEDNLVLRGLALRVHSYEPVNNQ